MDIKDFILIGGGLLIAAVVAHGFWIAWRERRQELRIDIKPHLIPDDVDDMVRLRGELPNGGGRVIKGPPPRQEPLDLEAPPPLLLEPTEGPPVSSRERNRTPERSRAAGREPADFAEPDEVDALLFGAGWKEEVATAEASPRGGVERSRTEPVLGGTDDDDASAARPSTSTRATRQDPLTSGRAKVADVDLPDPIIADEPKRPRRLSQRRTVERPGSGRRSSDAAVEEMPRSSAPVPVEELIVMNVLAAVDAPYTGDELFTALRSCGLKFGDMNIFHRVEPLTKAVQYSVASAVEPGTFDMAEMESIRCPGLCMFMQLPGPEDPSAAFEDMLSVARSVTRELGGDVKDEHRNVMTPQTVEHYRQRIVDFSRRRMSKRA
ncbi:MAG: cell division protein ZipA [Pseudomonadales bacterium]